MLRIEISITLGCILNLKDASVRGWATWGKRKSCCFCGFYEKHIEQLGPGDYSRRWLSCPSWLPASRITDTEQNYPEVAFPRSLLFGSIVIIFTHDMSQICSRLIHTEMGGAKHSKIGCFLLSAKSAFFFLTFQAISPMDKDNAQNTVWEK